MLNFAHARNARDIVPMIHTNVISCDTSRTFKDLHLQALFMPPEPNVKSDGLNGKIAAWTAILVAAGGLLDAAVSLATKTQSTTCGFGISLPWCTKHTPDPPIEASPTTRVTPTKTSLASVVAIADCGTNNPAGFGKGDNVRKASEAALQNCKADCCEIRVTSDDKNHCIAAAIAYFPEPGKLDRGYAAAPTLADAKNKAIQTCSGGENFEINCDLEKAICAK